MLFVFLKGGKFSKIETDKASSVCRISSDCGASELRLLYFSKPPESSQGIISLSFLVMMREVSFTWSGPGPQLHFPLERES